MGVNYGWNIYGILLGREPQVRNYRLHIYQLIIIQNYLLIWRRCFGRLKQMIQPSVLKTLFLIILHNVERHTIGRNKSVLWGWIQCCLVQPPASMSSWHGRYRFIADAREMESGPLGLSPPPPPPFLIEASWRSTAIALLFSNIQLVQKFAVGADPGSYFLGIFLFSKRKSRLKSLACCMCVYA
jgi:hypothetical protein